MISERQANGKTNTSFNPVTGDSLTSKVGSQEAYASGWDLIWGKKEPQKIVLSPDLQNGEWYHCSPDLSKSGINCSETPRRECLCILKGSHDHWVSGDVLFRFKQQEIENSYKCNIVEQHFLQEQLPENIIGDEL